MSDLSYDKLAEKLTDLFERGEYECCEALTKEYLAIYPKHSAYLIYLRMCSAARLQNKELTLSILSDMLDKGIWYSEELLMNNPSLADLQHDPIYKNLLLRSASIKEQSFGADQTLMVLHDSGKCIYSDTNNEMPCPILVALHSNGELPQDTIMGWKTAAQLGMLVAIPKSSKTLWAGGGHYWINHHEASYEIYNQLSTLQGRYNIDKEHLVFGGSSMGGEIALWMALQGMMNSRGFILLAPDGPYFNDPIRWKPLVEDVQGTDLRGVIIIGEDDYKIYHVGLRDTLALLNRYGLETKLIFLENSKHRYPPKFDEYLVEAIEFIFS